jgi:hypothetical protein
MTEGNYSNVGHRGPVYKGLGAINPCDLRLHVVPLITHFFFFFFHWHYSPLWPVEQYPSIFPNLSPTLSIFSLPTLEDLFLLPLSILSCVFHFVSSLPLLLRRKHF